jgi:hypothetical protein
MSEALVYTIMGGNGVISGRGPKNDKQIYYKKGKNLQ